MVKHLKDFAGPRTEQVETDGKGLIEDFSDRAKARHVRGHGLDQHVIDLKWMNRR
jgi:hypothetical protein